MSKLCTPPGPRSNRQIRPCGRRDQRAFCQIARSSRPLSPLTIHSSRSSLMSLSHAPLSHAPLPLSQKRTADAPARAHALACPSLMPFSHAPLSCPSLSHPSLMPFSLMPLSQKGTADAPARAHVLLHALLSCPSLMPFSHAPLSCPSLTHPSLMPFSLMPLSQKGTADALAAAPSWSQSTS